MTKASLPNQTTQMLIRTSYPGQPVQVVEAPAHIALHFQTKAWALPFIEILQPVIKPT